MMKKMSPHLFFVCGGLSNEDVRLVRGTVLPEIGPSAGFKTGDFMKETFGVLPQNHSREEQERKLSLKQPDTMLLDSTGIQLYQVITGSLMFLSQCTRYDHLRPQLTGPSHEKTIQTTHDGSKASSPLPTGRYGPGNHVQDRAFRNDGVLRCELEKKKT